MDILRVSTIQSNLKWEAIDANLAHFSPKILALKDKTDIIILPEMFSKNPQVRPFNGCTSMLLILGR